MGRDKALLPLGDETLLERTARIVTAAGMKVIVVGRNRPEGWPHAEVEFIPDRYPGLGPLAGLAAALHHAESPLFLLPCDMPSLTTGALAWLAQAASGSTFPHGLIVRNGEEVEPLFSFYSFSSLPLAEEHLRRNALSLREFIAAGRFGFAEIPPEHSPALRNVNRPEEWEKEKRRIDTE